MPYPKHLLPKPSYKMITWREELRASYLLPSTPTAEVLDPETGKVRARWFNEINREQFKDYSTIPPAPLRRTAAL
mgnify:CR=1 FL=1